MKKEDEKYYFNRVKKFIPEWTGSQEAFGDRPDVIVTMTDGKTIGVELTEAIYDQFLMKQSEFKIKFNQRVIEQIQSHIPFKFILDIDLGFSKDIKQNQIHHIISGIKEFCSVEFRLLDRHESKELFQLDINWEEYPPEIQKIMMDQGYRKLPDEITQIKITRVDELEASIHLNSKGGTVPDFTHEHLTMILEKKNKSLINYKNCDEQWLIICEGSDFYSFFNGIKIEREVESVFDRVLLYRELNKEIVSLK